MESKENWEKLSDGRVKESEEKLKMLISRKKQARSKRKQNNLILQDKMHDQ